MAVLSAGDVAGVVAVVRPRTPRRFPFAVGLLGGAGGWVTKKRTFHLASKVLMAVSRTPLVAPSSPWSSIAVLSHHPVRGHGNACLAGVSRWGRGGPDVHSDFQGQLLEPRVEAVHSGGGRDAHVTPLLAPCLLARPTMMPRDDSGADGGLGSRNSRLLSPDAVRPIFLATGVT
jgi:hypothetical protein